MERRKYVKQVHPVKKNISRPVIHNRILHVFLSFRLPKNLVCALNSQNKTSYQPLPERDKVMQVKVFRPLAKNVHAVTCSDYDTRQHVAPITQPLPSASEDQKSSFGYTPPLPFYYKATTATSAWCL